MYSDEQIKNILGKNIKNERLKFNISQEELAEKVDLSVQFIRDIENARNIGSITTLLNICCALNITPNRILADLFEIDISVDSNLADKISTLDQHDKNIITTLLNQMNNI